MHINLDDYVKFLRNAVVSNKTMFMISRDPHDHPSHRLIGNEYSPSSFHYSCLSSLLLFSENFWYVASDVDASRQPLIWNIILSILFSREKKF